MWKKQTGKCGFSSLSSQFSHIMYRYVWFGYPVCLKTVERFKFRDIAVYDDVGVYSLLSENVSNQKTKAPKLSE